MVGTAALLVVAGVVTAALMLHPGGVPDRPAAPQTKSEASQTEDAAPAAVVRQFIKATFTDRDAGAAQLLTCRSASLNELVALLQILVDAETRSAVSAQGTSAEVEQSVQLDSALVTANLRIGMSLAQGGYQRSVQQWRFGLTREQGWRVCTAHRT